ncbi:MAG TPA: DUF2625 family protein [Mycobacteriales bacterium]|nr:DUF2625 family protein [Mycobacteriales bacterium]
MRPLEDLVEVDDPAWPVLERLVREAAIRVRVLRADATRSRASLWCLQVTARSMLGAVVLHTGGLVVDHGWLRLYGGGSADLKSITEVNGFPGDPAGWHTEHAMLEIGHDVLGGRWAMNYGALPGEIGKACYWAPDTLDWLNSQMGHHEFIAWCMSDRLERFYEALRWPEWRTATSELRLDEGLFLYPPAWSSEGQQAIREGTARPRAVPMDEIRAANAEYERSLQDVRGPTRAEVHITDE